MASVFRSHCKDCGEVFFFTDTARTTDTARGLSPPERCPTHRKQNAAGIRSVGAAYWDAPLETDDAKRCWGMLGLGRLVRVRPPPVEVHYPSVPVDLPLRPLESLSRPEDRELHKAFHTIAPAARDLVRALEDPNGPRVAILVGPTGTGKSTWVPYCLLQSRLGVGRICVTQPRTITLRQEQGDLDDDTTTPGFIAKKLLRAPSKGAGQEVGLLYKGESSQFDRYTKLLFATDGIVIRWLTSGEIAQFNVLMIDEAHEQSENMEQIFALLRYKLPQYPRLRVVIASATIAARKFQEHFGNGKPDSVPIFQPENAAQHTNFKIHDRWPDDSAEGPGYLRMLSESDFRMPQRARECPAAAAYLVRAIRTVAGFTHLQVPTGDILVFMPTVRLVKDAVEEVKALGFENVRVLSCYSGWDAEQQNAFYASEKTVKRELAHGRPAPFQRVIVATTLAETSITVSGLRYVIDSGYVTSPEWDAKTCSGGVEPQERHTVAGCTQRKGRVGRKQDGECFRLYTKQEFDDPKVFPKDPRPEVARSALDKFLLTAKACGIDDLASYKWIGKSETPPEEVERAQAVLRERGAVDEDGDITPGGVELERVQADSVDLSAFMVDSDAHACALEVAAFVAFVSQRGSPFGKDEAGLLGFQRWRSGCYDDLEFYLRVLHHWRQVRDERQRQAWCKEHGVSDVAMVTIDKGMQNNLRQFDKRAHDRLENRELDVEHLHRTRLVLTRCMPKSAFVRSTPNPLLYVPFANANAGLTAQIDQDSACAGLPDVAAFLCVERRRDDRATATVVARHVVRIDPKWLQLLPTAGPLLRARLIRQALREGAKEFVAAAERRILDVPPTTPQPLARVGQKGHVCALQTVREGRAGDGGNLVLCIDASTGLPAVLKAQRRTRQLLAPGTAIRGIIAEAPMKGAALVVTQEGLEREYLKHPEQERQARVVDVVMSNLAPQVAFVVVELELGVEGILFPEKADLAFWSSVETSLVGRSYAVVVLPSAGPRALEETDGRLRLQTPAFAKGQAVAVDDSVSFRGYVHSFRYEQTGTRVAVRYERQPGHVYVLEVAALPAEWGQAVQGWQIGQHTELVVVHEQRRRVLPKEVLDASIKRFAIGTTWKVTVKTIVDARACAFVELSPYIDGVLPLREIAWTWVERVSDALGEGQEVTVEVIDVDLDLYTVCCSIKKTLPDPYAKYRVGAVVEGTVTQVQDHAAFVEMEPSVRGRVHVSEIAWRHVKHPADYLREGDRARCLVVRLDTENRRMDLSIKQLQPDPWSLIVPGSTILGHVRSWATNPRGIVFGAFVEVADGIEGLVHISEMAAYRVGHPSDVVRLEQSVNVKVLSKEAASRKIALSIKQASSGGYRIAPQPLPPVDSPRINRPTVLPTPPRRAPSEPPRQEDKSLFGRFKKWLGI